jgi:hypothetical protein
MKKTKSRSSAKKNRNSGSTKTVDIPLRVRYLSDKSTYKEFKNLRYKGKIYRSGDPVLIRNEADEDTDFVCRLLTIYRCDDEEGPVVLIEVEWY